MVTFYTLITILKISKIRFVEINSSYFSNSQYYTNIDWLDMEYIKLFDPRDGASQLDYCLRP